MAWIVQRYIILNGGSTLWDPDPQATQPGEFAVDGTSTPIPIKTAIGGQAWGDVILVDDAGEAVDPGAFTVTDAFVKRTAHVDSAVKRFVWNRGELSIDQLLGIEQTQAGMESPAAVAFIVTGGTNTPASGRIAVRVWDGPR